MQVPQLYSMGTQGWAVITAGWVGVVLGPLEPYLPGGVGLHCIVTASADTMGGGGPVLLGSDECLVSPLDSSAIKSEEVAGGPCHHLIRDGGCPGSGCHTKVSRSGRLQYQT